MSRRGLESIRSCRRSANQSSRSASLAAFRVDATTRHHRSVLRLFTRRSVRHRRFRGSCHRVQISPADTRGRAPKERSSSRNRRRIIPRPTTSRRVRKCHDHQIEAGRLKNGEWLKHQALGSLQLSEPRCRPKCSHRQHRCRVATDRRATERRQDLGTEEDDPRPGAGADTVQEERGPIFRLLDRPATRAQVRPPHREVG